LKPSRFFASQVRLLALLGALLFPGGAAWAYIEAPFSLGKAIADSTNVLVIRVETVDKNNNTIIYRKVRDLKGTHPGEIVKHNIGRGGFNPREWQYVMAWAEPGQLAVMFHNGGAAETCIPNYWYQTYAGEWWGLSHGEPFFLRSFAGRPEKLAEAVTAMLAGQEVTVPCMVDGDKNLLHVRSAKLQRLKASLKLLEYNQQRDFAGWGAEEFRAIGGMPGFTHSSPISRTDPGARGIAPADFDGDGKVDFCLYGDGRVQVLQNGGNCLSETAIPYGGGAYSAGWADFNADGKPDLLLATPVGPKLFLNEGGGKFKDVSGGLPQQSYCHAMAAAWIDFFHNGGDKRPDILVADGFRGLRLYRNIGAEPPKAGVPKAGPWFYLGPFDNRGFGVVYPPEQGIDLKREYQGKGNEKITWKQTDFVDGNVISFVPLMKPGQNDNTMVFVYREIEMPGAAEVPVSLGSDDSLCVWLNGEKILAEDTSRGCVPDQSKAVLKLRPGKNALLLRVGNGSGEFAYYFSMPKEIAQAVPPLFEDVSDKVGLGERGIAAALKGDHLAVADVNGDGRPDVLFSAGTGILLLNTAQGFVAAPDSGIAYSAGGVAPIFGDFMGDKAPGLFVPQRKGTCKLFRNDGKGHFTDVTAKSGALAQPLGHVACATWADFNNRGRLDLLLGCLKAPNRYFRNNGDGTFSDASEELGLQFRIFNTRAIAVLDLNRDNVPDVVFNNEGQESCVLLGDAARLTRRVAQK